MTYSNIIETLRRQWIVLAVVMAVGFVAFLIAFPHFRKYTATATMLRRSDSFIGPPSKESTVRSARTPAAGRGGCESFSKQRVRGRSPGDRVSARGRRWIGEKTRTVF